MPFCPEQRQYRSFAASNFKMDNVSEEESGYKTRGYFTTFDNPYELMPGWFETIDRHALDDTDMSDVIMQYDHSGMVLARLRNGSLSISIDDHGGFCEADLSGCEQARNLHEAIRNGLIDEMSFGFTIADDGFEWSEDADGVINTRITKIDRLYDVSAVSIPANSSTSIVSARSYLDAAIEAKHKADELAQQAEQRTADTTALRKRKALALEMRGIELGYQPVRA